MADPADGPGRSGSARAAVPHVVILGGGFAGLYLAKGLRRAPVRITLVDRRNHHLFQPMLYQVAMAALSPGDIAAPIRSVLRRQRNVEVILGEAETVDTASRVVRLADGAELAYDWLAVATGARHSYFGRPEWEQEAPGLKSVEDALAIRRRILLAFERAEREPDPERRRAHLTFLIVGAGPTGVELAGALAEMRRYALRRDFRRIDSRDASVILLEGSDRVLASYPAPLRERALRDLQRLGVDVRLKTLVTEVGDGYVVAGGERIATETVVWAAGNEVNGLFESLGADRDGQGRVLVEPDCSIRGHPEVFVLGDAAAYTHHPKFETLPGICPVAMQQGRYAARVIRLEADGPRPARPPFRYTDKGQLAVIGRGHAVADIPFARFSGFPAWLLWVFVHIFFLIGFRNRVIVLFEWAWSYVTFQRGARLITGERHP